MQDCKQNSSVSGNAVKNTKRKPANESPMHTTMDNRIHTWSL